MDIETATLRGREAFKAGRKCVPALDPGFTAAVCEANGQGGNKPGAASVADLLGAWLRGWTLANVGAPVEHRSLITVAELQDEYEEWESRLDEEEALGE